MEYRRSGRGGAGNYYNPPPQQAEAVAKTASNTVSGIATKGTKGINGKHKDKVEVKPATTITTTTAAPPPQSPLSPPPDRKTGIATTGRGGAGNFTDRETLARSTAQNASMTPAMQERQPAKTGHSGRGGAGNYSDGSSAADRQTKRAADDAQRRHEEAVEMVDMTLKEPEAAHVNPGIVEDD